MERVQNIIDSEYEKKLRDSYLLSNKEVNFKELENTLSYEMEELKSDLFDKLYISSNIIDYQTNNIINSIKKISILNPNSIFLIIKNIFSLFLTKSFSLPPLLGILTNIYANIQLGLSYKVTVIASLAYIGIWVGLFKIVGLRFKYDGKIPYRAIFWGYIGVGFMVIWLIFYVIFLEVSEIPQAIEILDDFNRWLIGIKNMFL